MTRNNTLNELYPEALMEISPADAAELGLVDGAATRVTSRRGSLVLRARVTTLDATLRIVAAKTYSTTTGAPAMLRDGDRLVSVPEARKSYLEALGGRVLTYLFAVGPDFDFVIVAELPDLEAALVPPMLASATGTVDVRTTVLLTPAQLDAVTERARSLTFRAAGT